MTDEITTMVFAPSQEGEMIKSLLTQINPVRYRILKVCYDLANSEDHALATNTDVRLVLIHQGVQGFTTKGINEMVTTPGETARVVTVFVGGVGDIYDALLQTDAIVYRLPLRKSPFEELDAHLDTLLGEAANRMAQGVMTPDEEVPDVNSGYDRTMPGIRRQRMQVITTWSSKGGDGKSLISMELAYFLANVTRRKVLLVDADMNRGYFGPALGKEAMDFAKTQNITSVATLFRKRDQIPRLRDFLFNYPPATGKGAQGNLDILFGVAGPDQANMDCYKEVRDPESGETQGQYFVKKLIEAADQDYEFVIFDIGTIIPVHVHAGVLREVTSLIVVSSPILPAIRPTTEGLQQMVQYKLIDSRTSKGILVLNKFTDDNGFSEEEFPSFINLPLQANIKAIDLAIMQKVINQGKFFLEVFLSGEMIEEFADLARQILGLCEYYSPGALGMAKQTFPKFADEFSGERKGIFSARKKDKGKKKKGK